METYIVKVTNSIAKKFTSRIALAELVIGLYTSLRSECFDAAVQLCVNQSLNKSLGDIKTKV